MHAAIDWSTASVQDGDLTVELAGEASKAWADRLGDVIERLDRPGRGWQSVKVTRKRVKVAAVAAGSEGDLRHLLDSAAQQVNADFAEPEEDDGDDGASEADRAMTEAFRAFAEDGAQDDDEDAE
jgi:hypothetical protein